MCGCALEKPGEVSTKTTDNTLLYLKTQEKTAGQGPELTFSSNFRGEEKNGSF
jgi:hypothetical protein